MTKWVSFEGKSRKNGHLWNSAKTVMYDVTLKSGQIFTKQNIFEKLSRFGGHRKLKLSCCSNPALAQNRFISFHGWGNMYSEQIQRY